jgi:hypothetical protein
MAYLHFIWTDETVAHIAENAISQDEFEAIVCNPASKGLSRSTGMPVAWGHTSDGRYIMAVYEEVDPATVVPVTAYEVPEPR